AAAPAAAALRYAGDRIHSRKVLGQRDWLFPRKSIRCRAQLRGLRRPVRQSRLRQFWRQRELQARPRPHPVRQSPQCAQLALRGVLRLSIAPVEFRQRREVEFLALQVSARIVRERPVETTKYDDPRLAINRVYTRGGDKG